MGQGVYSNDCRSRDVAESAPVRIKALIRKSQPIHPTQHLLGSVLSRAVLDGENGSLAYRLIRLWVVGTQYVLSKGMLLNEYSDARMPMVLFLTRRQTIAQSICPYLGTRREWCLHRSAARVLHDQQRRPRGVFRLGCLKEAHRSLEEREFRSRCA
jgi:hypothetical protein